MGAVTLRPSRMGRRSWILVLALLAILTAQTVALMSRPAPAPPPLAEIAGGDWGSKLACFGCASTLVAVGGGSIGGILVYATLFPEAYGACAYVCVTAFA